MKAKKNETLVDTALSGGNDNVVIDHNNTARIVSSQNGNNFEHRIYDRLKLEMYQDFTINTVFNCMESDRHWFTNSHRWDMIIFKKANPFIFIDCDGSYYHNIFEHSSDGIHSSNPIELTAQRHRDLNRVNNIPPNSYLVIVYERESKSDMLREDTCIQHVIDLIHGEEISRDNLYFKTLFQFAMTMKIMSFGEQLWRTFGGKEIFKIQDSGRTYAAKDSDFHFKV